MLSLESRSTRPKVELATNEPGNPMKQDVKNGKLRFFTYGDLPFNYGYMPRTWEHPAVVHHDTGAKGDSDPLDMVELSGEAHPHLCPCPCPVPPALPRRQGQRPWTPALTPPPTSPHTTLCSAEESIDQGRVVAVRVICVLALIDDGETDWKILCIRADHPLANQLNDVDDLERLMPGKIAAVHQRVTDPATPSLPFLPVMLFFLILGLSRCDWLARPDQAVIAAPPTASHSAPTLEPWNS